jgi:uncharacterized protein YxjI
MAFGSSYFVLNRKLMSLGGSLWIEDAQGNHAFEVAGKVMSLRSSRVLQDLNGQTLYEIGQSLAHVRKTFEIKKDGQVVATIEKALMTFMRDKFKITLADGQELIINGNWVDREFRVTRNGVDVIYATRKLLSVRDKFAVQISPDFDTPLGLALMVALDQMEFQERS